MKKFLEHLHYFTFKRKFIQKTSKKQKFKDQPLDIIIALIFSVLCLIVAASLYDDRRQTIGDTVIYQFTLVSLEAAARILYSDLERRVKKNTGQSKSQNGSPKIANLWIALEILILCIVCAVISNVLASQTPCSLSTYLKTFGTKTAFLEHLYS